jgi:hypothetical protein
MSPGGGATAATYQTVDADGTLGPLKSLGLGGGGRALAVNADESIVRLHRRARLQLRDPAVGVAGEAFLSDFAATVASHVITDILVLGDGSVVACYFKSTVTRAVFVRRYDAAGTLLNTYTFTFAATITSVAPRLGYSSDDPASFWVLNHLTTGFSDIRLIQASDGAVLQVSLTPDAVNALIEQADAPLPLTSDSCPIIAAGCCCRTPGAAGAGDRPAGVGLLPASDPVERHA